MRFSTIVLASLTVFAAASLAAQVPASHALAARSKSSGDNGETTYGNEGDNYGSDNGGNPYKSDDADCPDDKPSKFPKKRLPTPKSMPPTDSYGNDGDDNKWPKEKVPTSTYDDGDNKEWPKKDEKTSTYGDDSDNWPKDKPDSYSKDGDDMSYGHDDDGGWKNGDGGKGEGGSRSSGKSNGGGDGGWNNGNRPSRNKITMPKNDFCPDCGDGWEEPCTYSDEGVYQEGGAGNKCPTKVVKHYNNGDNQCYSGSMGGSGPLIGALIGNCVDACILSKDCPDQRKKCDTPSSLVGQLINIEALNCLNLRILSTG